MRCSASISDEAARATGLRAGIPVVGGAADMIASALGAGVVAKGDVLLKFGGSVDILVADDVVAPDARMFLDYHLVPGSAHAERLHVHRRVGPQLVREDLRRRRASCR